MTLHFISFGGIMFVAGGIDTKEDGMGRAYSTHGKDEKFMQHFGWKT
jgi:hypothetical protein